MNQTTDCLIVGGGLIGMLTAREMVAAGLGVTIIEKGCVGGESSWAGGGILSPLYPWQYPLETTVLASWSQSHYPQLAEELIAETGIDPEWTQCGLLMLDVDEAEQALSWAQDHHQSLLKVDAEKSLQLEPGLGCPPAAALWMPQIAQVRNPRLIKSLKCDLMGRGVTLRENEEVLELLCQDGRVTGVRTDRGKVSAPLVVAAGGAWSAALLKGVGQEVKIEPVRGQMLLYKAQPGVVHRMVMQHGHYLIPRRDGHVLVGSTVEYVGFDKSITSAARSELQKAALMMMPKLEAYPLIAHWAGLRPGNRNGLPLIGPVPGVQGLFINSGHFRNGVVLGLGSARLVSDLMLERTAMIVDPEPYRITGEQAVMQ